MRMFSLKGVNPAEGIGDFVEQWRQPTPYRWRILALSIALTFGTLFVLAPKTERADPPKPDIIWINSWPANRSEAEIVASNIANQKRKDAAAEVQRQREEIRRNFYRSLARASGMDPDELAREFGGTPAPTKPAKAAPAPTRAPMAGTPAK